MKFSPESGSVSKKIDGMRYSMSHLLSTTVIARILLLAGILLAITLLASRSFIPVFAQETIEYEENGTDPVAVFTAIDPEGEDVTWALMGRSR